MTKYLVSFCNGGYPRLAVVGAEGVEQNVDLALPADAGTVTGLTGFAFHQSRCIAGVQSPHAMLAFLDRTFRVEQVHGLDEVSDLHGVASLGDKILVVSTGTNQVMAFQPETRRLKAVWSSADSLGNSLHLNDIAVQDGSILCSRFGTRLPHAMRSGAVFDLVGGRTLVDHVREPHSVAAHGGDVFVLESATGDLLRLREGFAPRRLCGIQGYARGLAVTDTHFVIGKSGYRANARHRLGDSRPLPFTTAGDDAAAGESGIYFIDRATMTHTFVATTSLGHEIYQITAIPGAFLASPEPPPDFVEFRLED